MKEKLVYKKSGHFRSKISKKIFLWHQVVHIMHLNVDRQGCDFKLCRTACGQTDGRRTDKGLKTEGSCQMISFTLGF